MNRFLLVKNSVATVGTCSYVYQV